MAENIPETGQSASNLTTVDKNPDVPSSRANRILRTFRSLLPKRKPAESSVGTDSTINSETEIERIRREILGAIAQRRSVSKLSDKDIKPFDNKAEEDALNRMRSLGGELTESELHRLAQLVAIRELPSGASLTEEMVAEAEKGLRSETPSQKAA